MRVGFLETDGGKVMYSIYGEGNSGTPLLIIHGGTGFLSMPQIISDFSADRPVYIYDQLGCGKPGKFAEDDYCSLKNFVNEMDEVIKKLELPEYILMGVSSGCTLVCSYMLEKEPKGVKALILSNPYLNSPLWNKDQGNNMSKLLCEVNRLKEEKKITVIMMNIRNQRCRRSENYHGFTMKQHLSI